MRLFLGRDDHSETVKTKTEKQKERVSVKNKSNHGEREMRNGNNVIYAQCSLISSLHVVGKMTLCHVTALFPPNPSTVPRSVKRFNSKLNGHGGNSINRFADISHGEIKRSPPTDYLIKNHRGRRPFTSRYFCPVVSCRDSYTQIESSRVYT